MRLILLLLVALLPLWSYAQNPISKKGYYVIVGAFSVKKNAEKFNTSLHRRNMSSDYGYVPSRKLYYVYTLNDDDISRCVDAARELRKDKQFADAWVRYINEAVAADSGKPVMVSEEAPTDSTPAATITPEETPLDTTSEKKSKDEPIPYEPGTTEVLIRLYNAQNDRVVEGKILLVDTERGRLISEVEGNHPTVLPNPKSKSGKVSLVCDVVGYRKVQKDLDFNNPLADTSTVKQEADKLVVDFELIRYQKGDIRTLYNIYFYNDAAVMLPESKYEVNALLKMMSDNPDFRIRLHGHTNGNYNGKIIRRKPDGDFFSVAKDATTTIGSAKELSESRAEVIRDYLIANGIDPSRIQVKAWGGKRPLYDKNSANAKKNIRVDVEII